MIMVGACGDGDSDGADDGDGGEGTILMLILTVITRAPYQLHRQGESFQKLWHQSPACSQITLCLLPC